MTNDMRTFSGLYTSSRRVCASCGVSPPIRVVFMLTNGSIFIEFPITSSTQRYTQKRATDAPKTSGRYSCNLFMNCVCSNEIIFVCTSVLCQTMPKPFHHQFFPQRFLRQK